jgi:transposase
MGEIVMSKPVFVGVDVSKTSFSVSVIDEGLKLLSKGSFEMNFDGFNNFKTLISHFGSVKVALEATSVYHIPLVSFLINLYPDDIYLINPCLIKKFNDFCNLRKTKTDSYDCLIISKFLAKNINDIENYKVNSSFNNDLTIFSRLRENIVYEISQVKTMIKQYLYPVFPEAENHFDIFSETFKSILLTFPSAKAISQASLEELSKCIKVSKGRKISIEKIKESADKSIGIDCKNYDILLQTLVEKLIFLEKQNDEITEKLITSVEQLKKEELKILTSIEGIGEVTACQFIAEIQDINRFSNYKKISAYAGTDPTIKQSGNINIKGKISKRGNSHLRRVLWIMTTYVIMWNEKFNSYFKKKRNEGFSYKKAQMAVLNKLIRLIYSLISKNSYYDKNFILNS